MVDHSLKAQFDRFKHLVDRYHRFVLTTHLNPDGDGIGSEVALAAYLRSRNKNVTILNHDPVPPNYAFLQASIPLTQFETGRHSSIIENAEVICILDANQLSRLASLEPFVRNSNGRIVCIDHHLDKEQFAHLSIMDEESAATGQIVYHLLVHFGWDNLPPEAATALYVAIMTDTGSFRFPKTTAELHRIVAHLIECGADPVRSYQLVHEQSTVGRVQLLGKVLSTLQTAHSGRVALLRVTREMFQSTGTSEADTENFINYTLSIRGVEIGLMITELAEGIKISFRSKGDIPINSLAKEFGGNGHKNAAGARIANGTIHETAQKLFERAKHYLPT
ncbi:MAG TPA: bifunctional oligoribonuclease/PAP phosphatase NrnA [Bacteroidota bacterium]|nr:bifunctional oligoribonuclease/PAP phosphatase NrnA [Bacteroidota bacterium]